MTEDHSLVADLVKRGLITREEAHAHQDRNVILRALGTHAEVEVTLWEEALAVRSGDRFVLSTDGLHDLVAAAEIRDNVVSADAHAACEQLVGLANQRGGPDNITVGVVAIMDPGKVTRVSVPATRIG
jgi:protein phosphatase